MSESNVGGGGGEGGDGGNTSQPANPPIGDEFQWRERALAAEAKVAQLQADLATLKSKLEKANSEAKAGEQRRRIEQELGASDTLDLEVTRLLTEIAIGDMADPDIAGVVADLKRRKPFLFKRAAAGGGFSAMSPQPSAPARTTLTDLAAEARSSGDRRALLSYLRARRGA